jgi:hypothetical protein
MSEDAAALGVDVGGTFTDLVALVDGRIVTAKVPSTPRDQSEGVMAAVRAAGVGDVAAFAHGMTVATNALLERRGARTALVTTEGFRDIIEIGRQSRAHLYDLTARRPAPLIPRELRFCVREPFVSRHSGADVCCGTIGPDDRLTLISQMPTDGVIFSDGVLSDAVSFCSGAVATIAIADRRLRLVSAA